MNLSAFRSGFVNELTKYAFTGRAANTFNTGARMKRPVTTSAVSSSPMATAPVVSGATIQSSPPNQPQPTAVTSTNPPFSTTVPSAQSQPSLAAFGIIDFGQRNG